MKQSVLAAGVAALVSLLMASCENVSVDPDRYPMLASMRFAESAKALVPDSATWRLGGEAGQATLASDLKMPSQFTATAEMPRSWGKDTIQLSIWKYSIRTAVLPYAGSEPSLVEAKVVRDQLARDLLVRLAQRAEQEPGVVKPGAQGVRRVYAECITSREAMCQGTLEGRPVGMDSASLLDELCLEFARRKASLRSLVEPTLQGWSLSQWTPVVLGRIRSRLIGAADSAILFPPELWEKERVAFPEVLVRGGGAEGMSGAFAWTDKLLPKGVFRARALGDGDTQGVVLTGAGPTPVAMVWPLGGVGLRATAASRAGRYEVSIGVGDDQGRSIVRTDTVLVVDSLGALVVPVPGAGSRVVSSDSSRTWVAWTIAAVEVDSVWIDGRAVQAKAGVYGSWVEMGARDSLRPVPIRVSLRSGQVLSEQVVLRRPTVARPVDTVPPRLVRESVQARESGDSMWVDLVYSVEDSSPVDSVWIDEAVAQRGTRTWSHAVAVDTSRRFVVVRARDQAGNVGADTVRLPWRVDREPPTVSLVGPHERIAPEDSTFVDVFWDVADNGLVQGVRIGGVAAERSTGGRWHAVVKAGLEPDTVRMEAVDAAGNRRVDSVIVRRSDAVAPRIQRRSPLLGDTTIAESVDSLALSWWLYDPSGIAEVRLDGRDLGLVSPVSAKVAVPLGQTEYRLEVVDAAGNVAMDSIRVRRPDRTPPTIQARGPLSDTTVSATTDSLSLAWAVADRSPLAMVVAGGRVVDSSQGLYRTRVKLQWGRNVIQIQAWDAFGNARVDSIVVDRAVPNALRLYRDLPSLRDTMVVAAVTSVEVRYFAQSASGVDSVRIDGQMVPGDGLGMYGRTVPLAMGVNRIATMAWAHDGRVATDTFLVRRGDVTPPLIEWGPGMKDTVVADSTQASMAIAWKVTDDVRMGKVYIQGVLVTGTQDIYSRTMTLNYGDNPIYIFARDSAGNMSSDTIVVRRPRPVASAGLPTTHLAGRVPTCGTWGLVAWSDRRRARREDA